MRLASFALLVVASASSPQPHFSPCCAYGGSGGAVALGVGVLNAFAGSSNKPTGPAYAAPMAVGISPSKQFATILFAAATGPEDATAGWIVTSNATMPKGRVRPQPAALGPLKKTWASCEGYCGSVRLASTVAKSWHYRSDYTGKA